MTKALMKRPCTALDQRPRLMRRIYTGLAIHGHRFRRDLDWRCETCNALLDQRLRPGAGIENPGYLIDPCPDPTPSKFETMLLEFLEKLLEPEKS